MNQILRLGQKLALEPSGMTCEVGQFLGAGGQGEVYRATVDGKPVALKWFFPHIATPELQSSISLLTQTGPPTEKFLWPIEMARAAGVNGFGYIMPLREPRFKNIVDLMKRRIEPTFRALATAGLELSDSYLQLHSKGFCYRDISFGNAFFDPDTGEILIADNDNVAVDEQAVSSVLGTPRFMAPEVVRGESLPSTETDLFSLSVLLFYMLMVHHPLEGKKELSIKCLDLPAMTKLYGTEPVFIFDPNDNSNEPVPGYHDNALAFWPIYPQFLRDLFTKAFTDGIRDPRNGRVRESEWRAAMTRLRDSIVYCSKCGMENFYDPDALKASGGKPGPCWSCKNEIVLPPRIRLGKGVVMLNYNTKLFPHHVDEQRLYDFTSPIAEVAEHPTTPGVWGLRNLSQDKWVSTSADGKVKDVGPGRNVALAGGTRINFGRIEGEIRS
ncbi:MAG TPA: serine/threonine protein kinase [Blastocatellia bacterium]|nr:serine/threonine protein kinase [Blastocatellia bacterium]